MSHESRSEDVKPRRSFAGTVAIIVAIIAIVAGAAAYTVREISRIPRCACELVGRVRRVQQPHAVRERQANVPSGVLPEAHVRERGLPRLVDLGASKCIPCKMMAPILEELRKAYAGKMQVEFIDVWENPDAEKKYRIQVIPTQIFFDASGKELYRHEGLLSKEDILGAWTQLGIQFEEDNASANE